MGSSVFGRLLQGLFLMTVLVMAATVVGGSVAHVLKNVVARAEKPLR